MENSFEQTLWTADLSWSERTVVEDFPKNANYTFVRLCLLIIMGEFFEIGILIRSFFFLKKIKSSDSVILVKPFSTHFCNRNKFSSHS